MELSNEARRLIYSYYKDKTTENALKKTNDTRNKQIKELMESIGRSELRIDNLVAKVAEVEKISFDQDMIIQILEDNGFDLHKMGLIKTKEYLDMEALENALFRGQIDPLLISPAQIIEIQKKLTIRETKGTE